jgi:hypothetical protein
MSRSRKFLLAILLGLAVALLFDIGNIRTDSIAGFRDGWNATR